MEQNKATHGSRPAHVLVWKSWPNILQPMSATLSMDSLSHQFPTARTPFDKDPTARTLFDKDPFFIQVPRVS